MNFEKCFQTACLSLICSGFLSIFLTGTVGIPVALLFLALLFWGWFRKPRKIRKAYQWLATGLILLFFLADLLIFSRLVLAVIRLMLALVLLKVFTREENRDYSTLFLLSFSLLLISSTSTISAFFILSAVAVLFTFVLSLILFEMREAYRINPGMEFSFRKCIQTSIIMTLFIVLLAIPIFLVIPRTALGMFGQTEVSSIGFSPTVRLGDMENLLKNGEVVMRVEVKEGRDSVSADMKWRGVALDSFNGRSWNNTVGGAQQVVPDPEGRYLIQTTRHQDEMLIEQSIHLEPFSSMIFTSHKPIQLSGFDRSQQLLQSGNQSLYLQPKPNRSLKYTLFSDVRTRTRKIKAFSQDGPYPKVSGRYLQLPELDPRVKQLAETVASNATSSLGQALLLESFLRSQFEYSLNHQSGNSSDPLGNFLFTTRTAHCEYFATAHVVMLRTLGIPARMINGFRAGEFNEWGDYFIVRQSDAHSWVEAYLPGSGWIEFDPTPAIPGQRGFSITRFIGRVLDNLDILWREIVTFDRYKQFGFFRSLVSNTLARWEALSSSAGDLVNLEHPRLIVDKISRVQIIAAAALILLVSLAGLVLWINRPAIMAFLRKRLLRLNRNEMVREYYLDMLRIMKSKGCAKLPAETPGEFLGRVRNIYPAADPDLITDIYIKTRFGGILASSRDLEKISYALRKLRKTEKNKKPCPSLKPHISA